MAALYRARGRSRQAVPLDRDSAGRYLPLLVAIMVYLAVLGVAGELMMTKLAERWDSGLAGALTVQIPPAADTAAGEAPLEAVVAALAATRSEERRVGTQCVSTGRSRWSPQQK